MILLASATDANGDPDSTSAVASAEAAGEDAQVPAIGPTWLVLAVGYDSASIWDGVTWTSHSIPRDAWSESGVVYTQVAWSGSLLVAMGATGGPPVTSTSRDGVTWEYRGPIWMGESLTGLTWAGTSFVAVGSFDGYNAISFTSVDATSPWTGPVIVYEASYFDGPAWNGSTLVASGGKGCMSPPFDCQGILGTSTDLLHWTVVPVPQPFTSMEVMPNGTSFMAVGTDSTSRCVFGTSPDGQNWSAAPLPFAKACFAAASDGSQFVVIGTSSSDARSAFVSQDGVAWMGPFALPPGADYRAITWNGSRYVAVGSSASGDAMSATSPDGETWIGPVSVGLRYAQTRGGLISFVAPPRIDRVSPDAAPPNGKGSVLIRGNYFQTGATVTFGEARSTRVRVTSAATITVTPPANDPGPVDVTVVNPDGQTATLPGAFVYRAPRR
ncbi:IPT/TIG domain-containing protein [Anaeromyxobacter oryzisoli]|uniref:IPT/TIG domain-containing protein n=1 Tax=Anaeromyxobacter oryzisoli TaxID=2925408 RepID=UPI001F572F5D|nr:IPT/TIG domain-containing protein [Anaeromyxobacter sp. SG63]